MKYSADPGQRHIVRKRRPWVATTNGLRHEKLRDTSGVINPQGKQYSLEDNLPMSWYPRFDELDKATSMREKSLKAAAVLHQFHADGFDILLWVREKVLNF